VTTKTQKAGSSEGNEARGRRVEGGGIAGGKGPQDGRIPAVFEEKEKEQENEREIVSDVAGAAGRCF